MIPGEYILSNNPITLNEGLQSCSIEVQNTADYPIAISSHYHFYYANKKLIFDRKNTYGMRLDIPSGSWIYFNPRETRMVQLVAYHKFIN